MARFLAHLLELPLEHLDLLALISDLGRAFLQVGLYNLVVTKLRLHVDLGASPLAPGLQNVDTPTLGRYEKELTGFVKSTNRRSLKDLLLMLSELPKAAAI